LEASLEFYGRLLGRIQFIVQLVARNWWWAGGPCGPTLLGCGILCGSLLVHKL